MSGFSIVPGVPGVSGTTIAAIASPPGPAQRGLIRVSGPRAADLVRATWRGAPEPDLARRALFAGRFADAHGTQPLLLLWMPAPHSFTREDVAEFHLPGSPPLLAAAFARLVELGAVPAEPGEFTRRAFHSGRIDLTRAEGVLALVRATNEAEARAARALLFGGLEQRVHDLRSGLEDLRALCEAGLDFSENDTGHLPAAELLARIDALDRELDRALVLESTRTASTGEPRIVLAGAPNAGKSTLFNALTQSASAIVSARPGTTRDALSARLEIDGRSLVLFDTAGLDTAATGIDRQAQIVSGGARAAASLIVWVVDAAEARRGSMLSERATFPAGTPVLLVWSKCDLVSAPPAERLSGLDVLTALAVSAARGHGLEPLWRSIARALEPGVSASGRPAESGSNGPNWPAAGVEREVALRHRVGLDRARNELLRARATVAQGEALELAAEHLRQATVGLDELVGSTTSEDVLDRIFARFCLGK